MSTTTDKSKFASLSMKERLEKRMELWTAAKAVNDKAKASGAGKLSGEDETHWQALDADIDALNELIEGGRGEAARQEKLSAWEAKLNENPGRQTALGVPGDTGASTVKGTTFSHRGHALDFSASKELSALASAADYPKNFTKYLTGRGSAESLGMMVGADNKGGYLAPMQWVTGFIKFLDDQVFMRQLGTVLPMMDGKSLGMLTWDTDPGDADWTAEIPAADISEDDAARVGKREMQPKLMTKLVKIGQKLLRSSAIPIDSYLMGRLGYKAGLTEEKAFLTGSGVDQPLGVFTADSNGVTTSQDIETGTSVDFTFDDCINLFYSLKGPYQQRATWLASREFFKRARKLKSSATGDYLWQPAPALGAPDTILTRPYKISEYVPGQTAAAWTAGVYPALLADFSYYWIVDSLQMEIQVINEVFTLKNQVGYKLMKETDGQPVLAEAFARMKLKT